MKLTIVGGGVSGVIAAIYAAKKNIEVTILERNDKLLKKLLMTGNGKCNYFNDDQNIEHYHSSNKELITNIINDKNIEELKKFYKELGIIPYIKNGYYYPYSNQASSVRELLLYELKRLNVKVIYNYLVKDIIKKDNEFVINNEIKSDKLILSTGSKAYPKTGSDGMGYNFLSNFNHNITKIYPALVQIKIEENLKELDGVRSEVSITLYDKDKPLKKEKGELQFTDYGISGICTFNLSYLVEDAIDKYVSINFIEDLNIDDFIKYNGDKTITQLFEGIINYKIIKFLTKKINIDSDKKWIELNKEEKTNFVNILKNCKLKIIGTNSFDRGQICKGGLNLQEINLNTMESLKVKNLYITGELLDIDGDCGGYNLTIAFITGYIAGDNIDKG